MDYPYDSRTSLVNGSSLTASFLSSLGDGATELVEGHEFSSSSSESSPSTASSQSDTLSSSSSSGGGVRAFADEGDMVADAKLDGDDFGVFYSPAGKPILSAERTQRAVAVFDSRPIYLSSGVTSWKELSWVGTSPAGTRTCVYVRTAATEGLLPSAWRGPLLNGSGEDISGETGKTIQFRIAMYSAYDPVAGSLLTPTVSSMTASCYVLGASERFYTARMSLGFVPKHVILTYNGTIPTDAVVQFAVTTSDEADPSEYKVITPNTVTAIDDIAESGFLKLGVWALGNTEIPFVVDEFAVAIGGDGDARLSQ